MQKKAIVTGGLGFIGSNLIKLLLKNNFFVINIDKISYASNIYNLKNIKKKSNYKFYKSDICNKKMFGMILRKHRPNVLFNLAAETHVDRSINNPKNFIRSNIIGVFNILECIKKYIKIKKKFRMIHVSTDEVYGDTKGLKKSKEGDKYQPSSPYSASKIAADQLAISYYKSFDLPIKIARPFNTYGPRQSARAVIPSIIIQLLKGKEVSLGDMNPTRDFNYVSDIVKGFVAALESDNCLGEVVNLGSNFEISIKDTALTIAEVMNTSIKIKQDSQRFRPEKSEVERLFSSNEKAKKMLNWSPEYSGILGFKRGLEKTIDWFEKEENKTFYKNNIYNI